ncbi:RTTN [Branchiostoma lanceolatum]|uniref:RTTN protein n=1 Tax=Branchiostoma lanceolatum TaxID=7740 RepID=A0A8K0A7E7_BRALA|nr:RTTN [Branchiostoma lanceolatum]
MGSNKEDINLTPLLNKLGHDLEEIRVRALLNILSKLEHGHDLEEIRVRALLNILSKLEHGVVWHDLEEIRVRALLNILSKLEHGVVCEADLVQQRPLLIRLLEWFNFRSCPLQEEVLGLLNRLAQHSSAVEILVSLGAVAFLSQLRKDVSAELQPITDQTLNQLLILPRPGPEEHSRECIYQHRATKFSSPLLAESSIPPMQEDTQPKQLTAASDSLMSQQNSSLDSQHGQLLYMEPKVGYFRRDSGSTATLMANLEQEQQEQVVGTGLPSPTCLRFSTFPWLTLTPTDRHVLAATNRSLNSGNPQLVTSSCEFLSNVVFYDFPAETFLQRPAIVKTLVSLLKVPADGGHDPSQGAVLCLRNLCVHLQARLAFYQDPALYCPKQDYLSHASSTVSTEMSTPTPQSDSLHSAMEETPDRPRGDGRDRNTPSSTYELHTVVFYKLVETTDRARADGRDRNTTSSTSSPSHSVSASSVRSGSDPMEDLEPEDLLALQSSPSHSISASSVRSAGSDPMEDLEPEDLLALQSSPSHSISASSVRSAGSDPMEDLEPEDLLALQFSQLSLPQFCTTLLANGPALLKSHDPAAVTQVLELLQRATGLMEEALTPEVWEDQSTVAAELVEELIEALDNTGEVLHFHNMQSRGPRTPENEVTHHRMVYTALAILTTHLLQAFVPLEKAADILPESLGSALALLAMDPSFQTTHPAAHEVVVAYMEQTSEDDYQLYSRAQHVCASIDCSVQFVKEQNFEGGRSLQEMVELAEGALSSLPYHQHLALVSQFVRLCSDMCKPVHANPQLVQDCTRVLLKFLAHPEEAVRHTAYQTCLNTVKEVLGISRATETASLSCRSVLFLVDPHVLYQLCCFGLAENKTKVGEMAAELLLYLLQGRLIMTTAVWNKLMDALLPVLPVLQGYASVETKLGRCVLGLLRPSSEGDAGCLPKLERFRGGLRLLMSRESSMREEAAAVVSQHLALEGGRAQLLPQDAEQAILKAQDILIVRQQQQPSGENQSSIFQPEDVLKLWDLYTSPTVEGVVRRSAAQQFTTILADKLMHETFRRQGGVDVTVNYLKQAVQGDNQELEKRNLETVGGPYVEVLEKRNLVPPCLCILRLLVQEDPSLRHALRQEMPLYLTVLRCALQSLYDDRTCTEAASLLTLLLFDEVASIQTWSRDSEQPPTEHFSLPLNVVTRYRLPLKPPTHHHTSPHQPECDADPRQLQEGPPAEMLRMAWNVPWEGGMDQLAAGEQETTEGIPASLILTSRDKLLLRSTHIKTALQFNINEIEGAPSHYVAKLALMRLALLLTSDVIGNGNGTASSGSIAEILFNLDWKPVFKRFLEVMPANGEDDLLLSEVLKVLLLFLKSKEGIRDSVSSWLLDLVLTRGSPLLWLLSQGDNKEHENMVGPKVQVLTAHRTLQKQLMALLSALCNHLVHREESRAHQPMLGDLAQGFLQRLHLADPSHFYDLASLESTLHCLVHVTARPDWSTGSSTRETLCQELLETLREVVLSFHVGRGSTTRSYMGKGVIKNASISLKHLALEMAQVNTNKDWPLLWLNTKSEEGAGLDWLVPLWAYRDPEVRAAGLGIAVLLSGSEEGRIALTTGCQQVTGGIWGTSISVLLDHTECSLVRQQAAAILVNLTSQALPTTPAQANDSAWQGPSVTDEDTGFTLVGLPALLALLHHCQFYTHVSFMLGNYYPHSVIQPVSVAFRQATESQSDTGGTTSTSASQCGLQAGHRVTERHGGHHVNFSFMLGNYYPHSVIQPVSVAFRQATESQSDTGGTTSTSASQCGLQAGHRVTERHWGHYVNFSFMLGNYYPHSVIQPVSVAFRQATESQSDTGGTTSTSVLHSRQLHAGELLPTQRHPASQCGLQAAHGVTERHWRHHVNFSFMLGNYYPHSVIQPVSVAFRQATESQSDTGGTTSTSGGFMLGNYYPHSVIQPVSVAFRQPTESQSDTGGTTSTSDHSTPTGDVGSSRSSLTSGEQYFTSTATLTTQMSATPVPQPAVVQGPVGGRASSRQSTDSTAGSTYSEPVGVDYPSVVTPDLLAALTRLVSNMVVMASHDALQSISQHNIFNSLLRFLDADILRIQLKEQRESTAKCSTVKLLLGELLHMHCSILSLMQTCVLNKPGLGKTFAQGRNNVKTVLQLLLVGRTLDKEDSMYPSCCTLWRSVYSFLSSVVQTDGRDATADITVSLANNWDTFFESVQSCLSVSAPAHLQLCTVHLLALLLAEDGQQQGKPSTGTDPAPSLSLLLDRARVKDADDEIEKTEPVSCGSALCLCLVQLYDSMGSRDSNMDSNMDSNLDSNTSHMDSRAAVGNSLALLLAHSKTAKHTALQSGFVDSTLEHMKDLHAQMNLDSLNTGKPAARRKDDPAVTDLLLSLHLLRNFMLKYQDGKAAAVEAGLSQVVHKLWSWAMTNHTLMSAMLGLLATYTAQCAKACSSLAASGRAGVKTSHEGSAGSSVVHSLVKMATKQTTQGSRAHLKTVFAVLANLALSNVCRGILWKSNFLQGFSAVVPGKGGKDKKQNSLAARWLAVLVNVSFSLDGQQMLIKISDMLGLLVEHVQSSPRSCQTLALLVLRNMCFHPANKPRMVAHEKVVETLLRCMETGSLHSKVVASSALWALVTNCQKGKVGLKNAAVVHRLEESWQAIRRDPPTSSKEQKLVQQCLYNMKTIVSVVRS